MLGIAYPSDAVYKGTDVTLYCCVNMDPQGLIDVAGVSYLYSYEVVVPCFLVALFVVIFYTWK